MCTNNHGLTILGFCGYLGAVGFGATFAPLAALTVDGWVRLQLLGVLKG